MFYWTDILSDIRLYLFVTFHVFLTQSYTMGYKNCTYVHISYDLFNRSRQECHIFIY